MDFIFTTPAKFPTMLNVALGDRHLGTIQERGPTPVGNTVTPEHWVVILPRDIDTLFASKELAAAFLAKLD